MPSFASIGVILLSSAFAAPTPTLYSTIYDGIASGLGRFSYAKNIEAIHVPPVASHDLPVHHTGSIEAPHVGAGSVEPLHEGAPAAAGLSHDHEGAPAEAALVHDSSVLPVHENTLAAPVHEGAPAEAALVHDSSVLPVHENILAAPVHEGAPAEAALVHDSSVLPVHENTAAAPPIHEGGAPVEVAPVPIHETAPVEVAPVPIHEPAPLSVQPSGPVIPATVGSLHQEPVHAHVQEPAAPVQPASAPIHDNAAPSGQPVTQQPPSNKLTGRNALAGAAGFGAGGLLTVSALTPAQGQ